MCKCIPLVLNDPSLDNRKNLDAVQLSGVPTENPGVALSLALDEHGLSSGSATPALS